MLFSSLWGSIAIRFLFVFLIRISSFIFTINNRMKFFFLPSVAFLTVHSLNTSCILNAFDILVFFPMRTLDWLIMILFWISSKILNIVSIHADRSIMICGDWAPNRFVGIKIKLKIFLHFVDQLDRNLGRIMSKRTKFSVWTKRLKRKLVLWIRCIFSRKLMLLTEFTFVTTRMIKLFYFIVRIMAVWVITSSLTHLFTLHMIINIEVWSSIVFLIVVEEARIFIMGI